MVYNNSYAYPGQYSSLYGMGTQTPSPIFSPTPITNGALTLPQTQTGFSYQNQFDTTGSTTPDLNTVLQMLVAIITQLMQTLGASGPGNMLGKDQTGIGEDTGSSGPSPGAQGGGGGCHGKGKPESKEAPTGQDPSLAPALDKGGNSGLTKDQQEFLDLVNQARKDAGLKPVTANTGMMKETTEYSQAIEDAGGGLTHTLNGSQFGDRIKKGYDWHSSANENLAQGKTAKEAFDALMNDPPHKANILDPNVSQIGIGHVGNTWTQDMAT